MNSKLDWLQVPPAKLNEYFRQLALDRQSQLTKPSGSLGQLEEIAIQLAAMQGVLNPRANEISITVFAGDHGIAQEGVSLFPQTVTAEMIKNFARGGAAINVLARRLNAKLEVINLGTVVALNHIDGVIDCSMGPGTANFAREPAMSQHQLERALHVGKLAVERARSAGVDLFIAGEMGIANTSAAAAIACALLDRSPKQIAGPGTGLDTLGVSRKTEVIQRALDLHMREMSSSLEILRRVGGFEIAAMCGAYIRCAQLGMPTLVDGFIATSAALLANAIRPGARDWMLFGHTSAEPGHRIMLNSLNAKPILNIGMRLGEGSGAAAAVPLLQLACALHNEMATFGEAGVSTAD